MIDRLCMVPCLNGRQEHLVSLLHPQLSMLMKLQFFDIYQLMYSSYLDEKIHFEWYYPSYCILTVM